MPSNRTAAAEELTRRLKELAAVRASSVNVTIISGRLVAAYQSQPEGDGAVAEIIEQITHEYGVAVDTQRS